MQSADIGFVFALRQEAVGILDRLKHSRKTSGNGWTFHTGKLDNHSVAVVLAGVGQNNAEAAAHILIDVFAPKILCSAGYAGGLSARLKRSNICIPEQVIREHDMQALDLTQPIPQQTLSMPDKLTLITVGNVVESPKQKQDLHTRTAAEIVDMETFAVAEVCRIREVPFRSIRVIFDAFDDRIPKDIAKILDNTGKGVSHLSGSIVGSILSRPSVMLDLVSLKRRAFAASERLALFAVEELTRRKSDGEMTIPTSREQ